MTRRIRAAVLVLVLAALPVVLDGGAALARASKLPPILFAARTPAPAGHLPGFGPEGRTLATGGRLLVRAPDGSIRPFLDPATLADRALPYDVADPTVSWDGATVVFAATTGPGAPWRLWRAAADGSWAEPLPVPEAAAPHDDFDPAFLPDGRIVFASTRFPQRAQSGGGPVSNLFAVRADGTGLVRLTTERNGAEEPSIDPSTGRVVYARWWFNRYLPALGAGGDRSVTEDRGGALPAEPVDLWHALTAAPDGDGARLAGGFPRVRHQTMAYQPIVLADGSLVGVQAEPGSLLGAASGRDFPHRLLVYPGGFAPARLVADRGLAPAALPDGRLLWSAPGPAGDRALYVSERPLTGDAAIRPRLVVDTPGLDDLDAVPLVARPAPPLPVALLPPPARDQPVTDLRALLDDPDTFRFDCLNVFANGPVDSPFPDAPRLARDLRIRFFAALDRPAAEGGDTLVLVREAPLTARGAVHEHEMPGDTPLFEQLVDADGRVVAGAHGPAHVPGFNAGRAGTGTKCVGCHVGHSALPVAPNYERGTWTNIAPSAAVTTGRSPEPGTGDRSGAFARDVRHGATPRTLVDRLARGPAEEVGWVFSPGASAAVSLDWAFPVEVREVILYAPWTTDRRESDRRIRRFDLNFRRDGQVVRTERVDRSPEAGGTRVVLPALEVDGVDIVLHGGPEAVSGRESLALNEIEVVGRLTDRPPAESP